MRIFLLLLFILLSPLSAAGVMECSDLLTCGECHLIFSLSDIVSFIRHKQSACRGGGLHEPDRSDDEDVVDDDDDDDVAAHHSCVNGTAPDRTDEDDKTDAVRANSTETSDVPRDEHPSRLGSTSLYLM